MKFNDCVHFLYDGGELERIASPYVALAGGGIFSLKKAPSCDRLIASIAKAQDKYLNKENINNALKSLSENSDKDIAFVFPVILREILLEKNDCCYETNSVSLEVLEYEREIIKKANKLVLKNLSPDILAYRQMLKITSEENLSGKEVNTLICHMKEYYGVNDEDDRVIRANLGIYPTTEKFQTHTKAQIEKARQALQKAGLVFSIRKSDGVIYDIIPEEIAAGIKKYFGMEVKASAYEKIIKYMLAEYKKQYFIDTLTAFGIEVPQKPNSANLSLLAKTKLKPSDLMGGNKQFEGLSRKALTDWCEELGLNRTGSKQALIEKLLDYYDRSVEGEYKSDYRVRFYNHYESIASLNAEIFQTGELSGISIGADGIFSETTNYIFEILLSLKPDRLLSKANITGKITSGDKAYLYAAVASEAPVNLAEHIASLSAVVDGEGRERVAAVIVVADDFTDDSVKECVMYYAKTDVQICLIKASELKELADKWTAKGEQTPFPIKYLRQNGRFDRKGCEFIG